MTYDLIIYNGDIITLEEELIDVQAVGVEDGTITKVWTGDFDPEEVTAKEWYNLEGKTLTPGFIDTHNHILMYSKMKSQVYCGPPENRSVDRLLATIKKEAQNQESTKWIIGYGYDDTMLEEQRHITREEIDRVAPDHPVFIRHISGHLAVVNSKALEVSDINDDVKDPSGGHFGRHEDGTLDGVLYELPVLEKVMRHLDQLTSDELTRLMIEASEDYIKEGITTNTDAAVGLDGGFSEYEEHIRAVTHPDFKLKMRYMVMDDVLNEKPFADLSADEVDSYISFQSNGQARLDSAKFFQDGSIQGYTGALRDGYHLHPEHNGALIHQQETLNEMFRNAHDRGFRIACHGNGDLAIDSIIQALTNALEKSPREGHLHRIEHLQTAKEEDLKRMAEYDIATSLFINHVYYWGDRHRDIFLGPERAEKLDPLNSVREHGLLYTLHSDNPITAISPLFSIWAAVNRVTRNGHVLGESEKIDTYEALKTMTLYGARLNDTEETNGSIQIGKEADFAVLGQNPLTIDPMVIKDINVVQTFIDGKPCIVE
ncbi:putative amidohydrolase YtcJ [Alkalibacillus filiformis]|uniref:Amidohydrolase YtcJ n=1 Tax=Alkalibacillus filiformis TaxID=200990 RepID=A0ABU0DX89_9BACI|nr:amidohydrolase [Alkalibacillus filiformis]MDQ0353070.1 putative amidohydrolase YtcJ [Alkalibacillus filiformis]